MSAEQSTNPFETALDRTPANFTPLTPLTFIERAAHRLSRPPFRHRRRAPIHLGRDACTLPASCLRPRPARRRPRRLRGGLRAECPRHLRGELRGADAGRGCSTPSNIRLDAATVAFILEHGGAKVLLTDREFSPVIRGCALADAQPAARRRHRRPARRGRRAHRGDRVRGAARRGATRRSRGSNPDDEWRAISLNYTSGTTGNPKGVVYHHRGAYLNALSNIIGWNLAHHPVYLDVADVPLQRVVLPVVAGGRRRDEHLHAQGGSGRHLPRHRRGGGDAHVPARRWCWG